MKLRLICTAIAMALILFALGCEVKTKKVSTQQQRLLTFMKSADAINKFSQYSHTEKKVSGVITIGQNVYWIEFSADAVMPLSTNFVMTRTENDGAVLYISDKTADGSPEYARRTTANEVIENYSTMTRDSMGLGKIWADREEKWLKEVNGFLALPQS